MKTLVWSHGPEEEVETEDDGGTGQPGGDGGTGQPGGGGH
jgi:hypothetical protein